MLTIEYTPVNFSSTRYPGLSKPNRLACSWSDMVWAAITVGRKNRLHVLQHGKYSLFEIIYRAMTLYANLQEMAQHLGSRSIHYNPLKQSSAYLDLDRSEKSAISYFLGITTSKLFAEKLFGVSWLMHLDTYKNQLRPRLAKNRRPDFVGMNRNSRWIVIEAKGRSNGFDAKAMSRAKQQAQALTQIAGQTPFLQVGVQSYFYNNSLHVQLEDPPSEQGNGSVVDISYDVFLLDYYRPFLDFLTSDSSATESVQGPYNHSYAAKRISGIDLWVGLNQKIYELLGGLDAEDTREVSLDTLLPLLPDVSQPLGDVEQPTFDSTDESERSITIGGDGTYVQLGEGWSSERMRKPPEQRMTS